ncbi:DEKNAAC103206 [Brettanomyces naardenensis]|uniref:2-dehydropantolactone reductase n=1 Tax=Brettanomyces naardenensis TaxID=13370 RepID=A0A448YMQ3_BRENA|nr:DEKNAAC103206 [Brettanomyces naardenensis]
MTHTIKLNNGNHIPVPGLGCWQIPLDEAAQVVYDALHAGFRMFDSAEDYGNEVQVVEGIARWIKEDPEHHLRKDVFYTTKIWSAYLGYEESSKHLKQLLAKAKPIGYIDLVLIHQPRDDPEKRHGSWQVLQEAVENGSVKNIGVSNYNIDQLKEVLAYPDLKIVPAINQFELSPFYTREELFQFNKKNGIVIEAYSPLARGRRMNDPDILRLAKKYGKSPAQIFLRWSVDKGFIPLPKTTHKERFAPNLDIFDFKLQPEEVELLSSKDQNVSNWQLK